LFKEKLYKKVLIYHKFKRRIHLFPILLVKTKNKTRRYDEQQLNQTINTFIIAFGSPCDYTCNMIPLGKLL